MDYRLKENRAEYFTKLYAMNLDYGIMPGLVYLYMPELAKRFGWDMEQKLWFAFINGMTQNPITSMKFMEAWPELPKTRGEFGVLQDWFDSEWVNLSYDQDRRHQKSDTPTSVYSYSILAQEYGSQEALLTGTFSELWDRVTKGFHSFGRLASFSYLEYVRIMGAGAGCDNLFLDDKSGSKSHRNGLLFLTGHDDLVWDKRQVDSHSGDYENFKSKMVPWLGSLADQYLRGCCIEHPDLGYFTFESQCCAFKNGFFKRRYPGVYADMALDRIKWYDDRGFSDLTKVFKEIREDKLPRWLREECEDTAFAYLNHRNKRAAQFADTGVPFRAEHFM